MTHLVVDYRKDIVEYWSNEAHFSHLSNER